MCSVPRQCSRRQVYPSTVKECTNAHFQIHALADLDGSACELAYLLLLRGGVHRLRLGHHVGLVLPNQVLNAIVVQVPVVVLYFLRVDRHRHLE
mgnify:CR=1 FL=1